MCRTVVALVVLMQGIPVGVLAQGAPTNEYKVEAFGSLGLGALSRFDDSTPFGSGISFGGGIGFRLLNPLEVKLDVHGMSGLKESVRSAMVVSASAAYHFSTRYPAVQPYVLGGVGMLRTNNKVSTYLNRRFVADFTDVGLGVNVGAGLRVFVTPTVSLRPEVTYINALWNSRENLSETRVSMAVGYHW